MDFHNCACDDCAPNLVLSIIRRRNSTSLVAPSTVEIENVPKELSICLCVCLLDNLRVKLHRGEES